MRKNLGSLDWARIVAAASIVAFHILPYKGEGSELALSWAVPFFFALSGYLNAISSSYDDSSWLRSRLSRLAVPYLVWTTLRLVDLRPINLLTLVKQYVLCMPTSTLWFLWTLMICTALAWLLLRVVKLPQLLIISTIAAVGFAVVCEWWQHFGPAAGWMYANLGYTLQMPFLWIWVYLLGMWLASHEVKGVVLGISVFALGGLLIFGWPGDQLLAYSYAWGIQGLAHGLLGLGAVAFAVAVKVPRSAVSRSLAGASLGVYLIHPLLIRFVTIGAALSLPIAWMQDHRMILFLTVAALSLLLALAMKRMPFLKWAVG